MFLDTTGDVGMYSTIAVGNGTIFIGYYDEINRRLKVARSATDGYNWEFTIPEPNADTGKGLSIAIDGENIFISTTFYVPEVKRQIGISVSRDSGDTWNTSAIQPESHFIVSVHPITGKYEASICCTDGNRKSLLG
jgi:hypothetical protein